ncbi:MAG: hypothetical protein HC888_01470 [Candidatus Competibacteraceae bacterium]|nr:hypothetical protein [Candidatus Competibacteraceae bacterium]
MATTALLSAVLGGMFSVVLRGGDRAVLGPLASDMVNPEAARTILQPSSPVGSLGAAVNPEKAFENLPTDVRLAPGFGAESTITRINPIGRVLNNKTSPTARSLQASLDTGGLAFDSVANIGGDVETLAKQHYTLLARAAWERDRILGGSKLSRLKAIPEFNEQVSNALRRGGEHEDSAVSEYAKWLRANFFEPLYREANAVDLSGFRDLTPDYIEKYAPRFARHSLIARDYDDFYAIVYEHSVEKLTDSWSKRITVTKERMARENEAADLLDMDIADAATKYAELRGEMEALPEQFDPQVRDAAERIRQLREDAKGATREEAKRLQAEAKAIENSNKEMLAPFQTAEKRLKNQFRLLGKSKLGIAGANRRLVERIEATLEAADKSRDLLVRKLNKLARGFEELSEEARDKAIDDVLAQVERMREIELKVTSRPEFDTAEVRAAMAKVDEAEAELRALTDLDPAMAADRIESIQSELIAQGELLAARRKAEVDTLTGKLRNPNEARVEAAAMRAKAQNRWFDLLKTAAKNNVQIEGDVPNIDQLAKYYAETVSSSYLGEHARLPFMSLLAGERGPELARVLDIDETRIWSNGKKLEDFLENDIDVMMRRYLRTMAPDIELKRKFGTVNPLDPSGPFMKKIEQEFADARAEASKIEDKTKREKELQKIASERDGTLRDLQLGLRRVRNLDGIPENPYAIGHRLGRAALSLNTSRMMGKMVIASMSDMASLMARHGPMRFMRDGLMPAVTNWKALKLSRREAQLAGTALDLTLHGRSAAFADIFDDLRMGTRAERANQFLANNIGFISGMDAWNQGMKTLAASMSIGRTTDALEKLAAGTAKEIDLFHLKRLGIDEQNAKAIWEMMNSPGGSEVVNGVRLPNTDEWGKAAAAAEDWGAWNRAMEAKRAFRAALARDVDDSIVTPAASFRPGQPRTCPVGSLPSSAPSHSPPR